MLIVSAMVALISMAVVYVMGNSNSKPLAVKANETAIPFNYTASCPVSISFVSTSSLLSPLSPKRYPAGTGTGKDGGWASGDAEGQLLKEEEEEEEEEEGGEEYEKRR